MEVHHHGHHPKKWKEYITEFIMLFAAVTLGFFAENIREHQVVNHRIEKLKTFYSLTNLFTRYKNSTITFLFTVDH
jgi:hypothetical protein